MLVLTERSMHIVECVVTIEMFGGIYIYIMKPSKVAQSATVGAAG